ncbi:MAG: hypothetical protein JSV86_04295 [Gemmatimonadota bacterium]|nr:MAG: hypothetical protein JSV86_04295 [Gemmatimonadota bacterium]
MAARVEAARPAAHRPKPRIFAAAGLVPCALILFQISFTRLISYRLFYHFVFLAIALSLLGLGAAGTYVATRSADERELDRRIHEWLTALFALIPVSLMLMANPILPSDSPTLEVKLVGVAAIIYLLWCSLLMIALNFTGGVVITLIFSHHSARMGALYGRDLIGAGIGCLLCVGLMKYGSPPVAFLFSMVLVFAALLPFHLAIPGANRRRAVSLLSYVGSVALAALILLRPPLRNFENFRTRVGAPDVIKHEWNHIIRTDHFEGVYVLDGEASTQVVAWTHLERSEPVTDPAYTLVQPQPAVAVIGFGGGPQVAEARRAGARSITAIDINPTIARWVVNEDRELNNELFLDPAIEIVVDEGRNAIRSLDRDFDVIVMHAIDTYAATAAGAYALTENFLYTKEAIIDYLRALSDEGVMTIQRWLFNPPRENMRLFVTALDALRELGVSRPESHVVMIAPVDDYELIGSRRVWGYLLLSKRPLSTEKLDALVTHVDSMRWTILYAPGLPGDTPFAQYVRAADKELFQASYPYIISTVTDARPYLFQFYDPLRQSAYTHEGDWATSGIYQSSAILLPVSLVTSVALTLLLIIAPLLWTERRARRAAARSWLTLPFREILYFTCLGVGFMALEVPLVQVLSLYLGHPTYGFSVVLVALLLSTGIGSLLADRINIHRSTACAAVATLTLILSIVVFPIVHNTIQLAFPSRLSLSLILVLLCGLPMGFPLALAIRELGRFSSESVAWAWAVNASASVVGSCMVMILMVFLGSHYGFGLSVVCYGAAAVSGLVGAGSPVLGRQPVGQLVSPEPTP